MSDYNDMEDQNTASNGNMSEDVDLGEEKMEDNLVSRKVYNDVIDEEIDLEKPEDIPPQNKKIRHMSPKLGRKKIEKNRLFCLSFPYFRFRGPPGP